MLPYRVCLGEHQGNHSLVVYSARGIEWRNIHPDLEKSLKQIDTRDILDLTIGNSGLYYLSYREGATVRQVLTPKIWDEIISEKVAFRGRISKIAFGNGGEFWAVIEENGRLDVVSRLQTRGELSKALMSRGGNKIVARDVAFIALGKSNKNFVVKIGKDVFVDGHRGVRGRKARELQKNAEIIAAALSPLDNTHFFVTFSDGSHRDGLPSFLRGVVRPHLDPSVSLLRVQVLHPVVTALHSTPEPSTSFVPTLPSPPWTWGSATQLMLLDHRHPDYMRSKYSWTSLVSRYVPVWSMILCPVQGMFYDRWMHPAKSKPDLRYIYEVKLPARLLNSYLSYRLEILKNLSSTDGLESELFHGTSRRCLLGNEPELDKPCDDALCRLCCILRLSFMTTRAGTANAVVAPS